MQKTPGRYYDYARETRLPGSWRPAAAPSGRIAPFREYLRVLPFSPYTRLQRLLHRLHVCRWHEHAQPLSSIFRQDSPIQGSAA